MLATILDAVAQRGVERLRRHGRFKMQLSQSVFAGKPLDGGTDAPAELLKVMRLLSAIRLFVLLTTPIG